MLRNDLLLAVCLLLSCAAVATSQSTGVRRCFRFTWLGPTFNNASVYLNATCQDATRLASGIPCQEPLVVSDDGTWPDVDYIWRHFREQATCVLADNDVCAQFTYYFNGHAENSTYMCTRAVNADGIAITSGCYEQREGSFSTRVCLCRSVPGGMACNNAVSPVGFTTLLIVALALVTDKLFLDMWPNILT